MKYWLVASYKSNDLKKLQANLQNQGFEYYLPKIITKKVNGNFRETLLFPGYIFVKTTLQKYSTLRFSRGIKDIVKFGNNISYLEEKDITLIKHTEEKSKTNPIVAKIEIGQEAIINTGALKGNLVKICSLPSKERVDVFLSILGSVRKISLKEDDISLS